MTCHTAALADVVRLFEWQCLVWRRDFGKLADCDRSEPALGRSAVPGRKKLWLNARFEPSECYQKESCKRANY